MDSTISRAERYVRQDSPRFQTARRGWMGEGNRSVPTGDSPATSTEVRSVESSVLVSLDIMVSTDRTTLSSSSCLSAHNQIAHTLFLSHHRALVIVSVCLYLCFLITTFPTSSRLRSLPQLLLADLSHVDSFYLSSSVVFRPGLCPHLPLQLRSSPC